MNKKIQKGFTLVELMITVTIVAVLSAIAIPAYQGYIIKAQIAEGLYIASSAKIDILEFHAKTGAMPSNNLTAGYGGASSNKIVSSEINDGKIHILFNGTEVNKEIQNKTIILAPYVNDSNNVLHWSCESYDIDNKYVPTSCRPLIAAIESGANPTNAGTSTTTSTPSDNTSSSTTDNTTTTGTTPTTNPIVDTTTPPATDTTTASTTPTTGNNGNNGNGGNSENAPGQTGVKTCSGKKCGTV
jgi:type IV pilus assembly protein PilA